MRIIKPSVKLHVPGEPEEIAREIERMARISHRSEDRITDDSWRRFLDLRRAIDKRS